MNFSCVLKGMFCVVLLVILSAQSTAQNGNWYYHLPEGKYELKLSTNRMLVKFNDNVAQPQRVALLQSVVRGGLDAGDVTAWRGYEVVDLPEGTKAEEVEAWLDSLNSESIVAYAHPFFSIPDGSEQSYTDVFIVGLKQREDLDLLRQYANQLGLEMLHPYKYDSKMWFVRTLPGARMDALQASNFLFETSHFSSAEPDFLIVAKAHGAVEPPPVTNDPDYQYQWHLENSGNYCFTSATADADIDAETAWMTTGGIATIKIAVIDDGLDTTATDLTLLSGYNATTNDPYNTMGPYQGHGDNVARIAAAQANNNICGAGVAYGCSVIPVKVLDYLNPANYVVACQASFIATGIDWAWQDAGADVLNNSWGGGSPQTIKTNAINRATTQGRGGLGCAVLFSTGNSNLNSIAYPASLSNVIAVGASSPCDERKYHFSCDNDNAWGSNYGTGLDVMAPGTKIAVCGINNCNTQPTPLFGGTSAACPIASGTAALILSKNPSITFDSLRYYLESTCDKVWNCNYQPNQPGQPNGTWCPEMGYGRINAGAALAVVPAPPATDVGISVIKVPPCTGSSSTVTVTIDNYGSNSASGIPIEYRTKFNNGAFGGWTSAGTYSGTIAAFGEGTHSFTISAASNGDYTIEVRTVLSGDTITANDDHFREWTNNSVNSFPYAEDFENNDGNWTATNTWAWGTPSSDFIRAAGSGSKAWVTNLSGKYQDSTYCARLISPCFDFSGMSVDPIMTFKLIYQIQTRLAGQLTDYAWIELSTDGGVSWTKIGSQNSGTNTYNDPDGWMGITQKGPGVWLDGAHVLSGTAGKKHVKVRFVFWANEGWELEGIGIDNVQIFEPPANDARILSVDFPNSDCSMGVEPVEVTVQNLGSSNITNFPIEYRYQINGGAFTNWTSVGNFPAILGPGEAMQHPFTVDFSTKGTYNLEVRTQLSGDANTSNDAASRSFNHYNAISSFPATESFESGSNNWYAGGQYPSWELGAPAGTTINSASDGSNAWVTNLSGMYNWQEVSWVQSACFDMSSLTNPEILMDINYETWSTAGANVEYSIDGGQSWVVIGAQGDPNNWYNSNFTDLGTHGWTGNSNGWLTAQHSVSALAGESEVIFRINFGTEMILTNTTYDGFGFDKFIVRDLIATDASVEDILEPGPFGCSLGANAQVVVVLRNNGANSISNIPVEYRTNLNGGGYGPWTSAGTYSGTISANDTVHYSFTANFAQEGEYQFQVRTQLSGDQVPANDMDSTTITNFNNSIPYFPVCESFESSDGGWTVHGTNPSWAWGTPSGTVINSTPFGSKVWATNLSGNYNNNELSYLLSPCLDLSSMNNGKISIALYYLTESSKDGLKMQYSIDGGLNWTTETFSVSAYNDNNITAFAGLDSKDGWSGNSGQWVTAQAYISPLGSPNVLIRFIFGSDGANMNEGVAIDNICIYDLDNTPVTAVPGCNSYSAMGVSGFSPVDFLDENGGIGVTVNPQGNNLGTVTLDVNDMASVPQAANNTYYLPRYFNIDCSGGADCPASGNFPQGDVYVTLYFEVPELDDYNNAGGSAYGIADLYVTHYNGSPENCTLNDNSGGTYTLISKNDIFSQFINNSTAFSLEFPVSTFSEFGAHGTATPLAPPPPLPLELLSFDAVAEGRNKVNLFWTTAQEVNLSHFEVEHSSNGINFQYAGAVAATGSGSETSGYHFSLPGLPAGTHYFRLRMVDIDGSAEYSPVRVVELDNSISAPVVLPNPNSGRFKLLLGSSSENRVSQLRLVAPDGRLVWSEKLNSDSTAIQLPATIRNGVYLLEVQTADGLRQMTQVVILE